MLDKILEYDKELFLFLNNLAFADRAVFYGSNFAVAVVILLIYAGIAWLIRRRSLGPVTP